MSDSSSGEQEEDTKVESLHHRWLTRKHIPPPLSLPDSSLDLSALSTVWPGGVKAASGGNGSSHVSVKHKMEESLNSRLNDNRWNSSSVLFLSERTLTRTVAGSGGLEPRRRNLHSASPRLNRLRARDEAWCGGFQK